MGVMSEGSGLCVFPILINEMEKKQENNLMEHFEDTL